MPTASYSTKSYLFIGLQPSESYGKKYDAILVSIKTGKQIKLPFGERDHNHYKDATSLNMYSDYNGLNEEHRHQYRITHSRKLIPNQYSEAYFNLKYLW